MTIGYGFGHLRINHEIIAAGEADPSFGLFVVDANGRKVFRPQECDIAEYTDGFDANAAASTP